MLVNDSVVRQEGQGSSADCYPQVDMSHDLEKVIHSLVPNYIYLFNHNYQAFFSTLSEFDIK